jgi:hypothetical protein
LLQYKAAVSSAVETLLESLSFIIEATARWLFSKNLTLSSITVSGSSDGNSSDGVPSSGLSTGAKVGIVVGVVFGVIAIAIGALLLWRRQKTKNAAALSTQGEKNCNSGVPELDSVARREMDASEPPREMEAAHIGGYGQLELPAGQPVNMSGGVQQRYELPAQTTPVEIHDPQGE